MITERHQKIGSWSLQFKEDATPVSVLNLMDFFEHIVITDARVNPDELGDTAMLSIARYTGVIQEKEGFTVGGGGLQVWLEDQAGKSTFVYEVERNYVAASFVDALDKSSAVFGILRNDAGNQMAIRGGALTALGGTYTNTHLFETPKQALDAVMSSFAAEYRINPDATLDAGLDTDLFVTTPTTVIVRRASGDDPTEEGLAAQEFRMKRSVKEMTSRAIAIGNGLGSPFSQSDDAASFPFKDIFGSNTARVKVIADPAASTTVLALARAQFEITKKGTEIREGTIALDEFDVRGTYNVGDSLHVYDPDQNLFDTSIQVEFRGRVIFPISVRLMGHIWPVKRGMGVYHRSKDGTYTDLSDYVIFEDGGETLEVGTLPRSMMGDELAASKLDVMGMKLANDLVSPDWDGANPASLSSKDGAATSGFYMDASLGASQFMGNVWIDGTLTATDAVLVGDVSGNWDGANPANLATRDATATTGFYLDGSVGSMQLMGDIFIGGSIILDGTAGTFVSGASGGIVEIGGGVYDSVEFHDPGHAVTEKPSLRGVAPSAGTTNITLHSGRDAAGDKGVSLKLTSAGDLSDFAMRLFEGAGTGTWTQGILVNLAIASGGNMLELREAGAAADILHLTDLGNLRVGAGTEALPSHSFIGDPDTGIRNVSANVLGFIVGASERFQITSAGEFTAAAPSGPAAGHASIVDTVGTTAVPAYVFHSDWGTGMYRVSAGVLGWSVSGVQMLNLANGTAGILNIGTGDAAVGNSHFWHTKPAGNMYLTFGGTGFIRFRSYVNPTYTDRALLTTTQFKMKSTGSVSTPSFSWETATNYGMWIGSAQVQLTAAGAEVFRSSSTETRMLKVYSIAPGTGTTVVVTSTGLLRRTSSAKKRKKLIKGADWLADVTLRPVEFKIRGPHKEDVKHRLFGLIADEVAEVLPDAAIHDPDTNEIEDYDNRAILAVLVAKVNRLEAQIKAVASPLEGGM